MKIAEFFEHFKREVESQLQILSNVLNIWSYFPTLVERRTYAI